MTDLDTRLDRAFKGDALPPRDPMFRIAVLERRERAGFRRRLLIGSAIALAVTILSALALGAVDELVGAGAARLAVGAAAVVVLTAILAAPRAGFAGLLARWRARTPGFLLWR